MVSQETTACFLLVGSALSASLQAMDAKYLGLCSIHWTTISLAMNGSTGVLFLLLRRQSTTQWNVWLFVRALLGGVSLNAALAAVTHVQNLATANTVMFSMPCFATLIACCIDRQLPSKRDSLRLFTGFAGTLLVVGKVSSFIGVGCAATFAICNAAACVVTSRKLENADGAAVCGAQAAVAFVLTLVVAPRNLFFEDLSKLDQRLWCLLVAEIVSLPLSLLLRTEALLLTTNVHVISLLYSEIPMVITWDRLFCGVTPTSPQLMGVAVIVVGAALSSTRAIADCSNAAAVGLPTTTTTSYDSIAEK